MTMFTRATRATRVTAIQNGACRLRVRFRGSTHVATLQTGDAMHVDVTMNVKGVKVPCGIVEVEVLATGLPADRSAHRFSPERERALTSALARAYARIRQLEAQLEERP